MNRIPWLICLLLAPLAAMAAPPRSIVLTIQDNGHAQVAETHDLEQPGPDGLVRISPLPATLLPASVGAAPIERGETLDIRAQRFAFDLADDDALFRAFRGMPLICRKGETTLAGRLASVPDFSGPAPALTLEAEGQPVRFIPDLRELDAVEFPARADLARTPTLIWDLGSGQVPPAGVQLHYAAAGFSWSAAHEAVLADDGRTMTLATRVCIRNQTGRDFPNARIRLALTDKGRFAPLVPAAGDPRAAKVPALRYSVDGQAWIPERAAAATTVIATYDLLRPLTLPAGAEVRAGLAAATVPVETTYVYDGVRFDRFQRNRRSDWNLGTESSPVVETRLVFRHEQAGPLPPGEFRLLRGAADRALDWLGTDWLPALKPGETATLNLGPAAGLSGQRLRTGYAEIEPLKSAEETFEITLENQTAEDRTIAVIEHLYRGESHEITAASAEHAPGADPHSIRFQVPVKAGTKKSFTYTVHYTW